MLAAILYVNVFLAGVVVTLAVWYAYAHYIEKKNPAKPKVEVPSLPKETRERLMLEAENKFHKVLQHATGELQVDLKLTSDEISAKLKTLGEETATVEMKRYQAGLEEIRLETENSIKSAAADVQNHQTEIKSSLENHRRELQEALEKNMADEKQRLIGELDSKLSDAVTAFLLETLGHEVDLGAQTHYITKMLDEHKEEIVKELGNA